MQNLIKNVMVAAFALFLGVNSEMVRAQWNPDVSVNLQISGLITADMETVSTTDGKLWVAFYHQNGSNYDMRAQLFDAAGNKLLGPDGVLVSNKNSGTATYVYNVCVDGSNNLIISCQDERSANPQAVLYKISQAGTHLWSSDGVILGEGLAPYSAVLTNGEVISVWNEWNDNTLKMQKITTGGTLAWGAPIPILVGTTKTSRGQVVPNLNNKFTIVYQKKLTGIYSNLYAQQFDNTGTAVYTPMQICNQTTAAYNYYSISSDADTTYYGYFCSSGNRFNSFLQRINPNGTIPWGMNGSNFNTSTSPSDNYQGTTAICQTSGSPYVWSVCTFCDINQTIYGVYVQKFLKSTGGRLFTDLGKEIYPISSNRDTQAGNLLLTGDNPLFMTYDNDYKIYATRLDANGNFVWPGNRTMLSSTTATLSSPKGRYGFGMVGSGWCAAIWTEDRGAGDLGYIQGVTINGAVGINKIGNNKLEIYPNPNKGRFTINAELLGKTNAGIELYNGLGELIWQQNRVVDGSCSITVELKDIKPGLYLLVLRTKDHCIYKKVSIL